MKRYSLLVVLACLFVAGCTGEEHPPRPDVQGPAGGEHLDMTAPNAPASSSAGGQTASAFPSTNPPTDKGAH